MRVQIPAYTDRWMQGDRYAEVLKCCRPTKSGQTVWLVKLDLSGRTMRVLADDCQVVGE
jgi:hypothetical protein